MKFYDFLESTKCKLEFELAEGHDVAKRCELNAISAYLMFHQRMLTRFMSVKLVCKFLLIKIGVIKPLKSFVEIHEEMSKKLLEKQS